MCETCCLPHSRYSAVTIRERCKCPYNDGRLQHVELKAVITRGGAGIAQWLERRTRD